MNLIKLGEGNVAVSAGTILDVPVLIFEEGVGTGKVGENPPDRPGGALTAEKLDQASAVIQFDNRESINVVIAALEECARLHDEGNPEVINSGPCPWCKHTKYGRSMTMPGVLVCAKCGGSCRKDDLEDAREETTEAEGTEVDHQRIS